MLRAVEMRVNRNILFIFPRGYEVLTTHNLPVVRCWSLYLCSPSYSTNGLRHCHVAVVMFVMTITMGAFSASYMSYMRRAVKRWLHSRFAIPFLLYHHTFLRGQLNAIGFENKPMSLVLSRLRLARHLKGEGAMNGVCATHLHRTKAACSTLSPLSRNQLPLSWAVIIGAYRRE